LDPFFLQAPTLPFWLLPLRVLFPQPRLFRTRTKSIEVLFSQRPQEPRQYVPSTLAKVRTKHPPPQRQVCIHRPTLLKHDTDCPLNGHERFAAPRLTEEQLDTRGRNADSNHESGSRHRWETRL